MSVITSIGEILIDLTQTGTTDSGVPEFAAYPGGAPANLAVAAARLGADTSFIGKVGNDSFGDLLRWTLVENNVDATHLYTDPTEHTTVAVVSLDEHGERSFTFYRSPGADSLLTQEEAIAGLSGRPKLFHFGSVTLTKEPARSAISMTATMARRMGALITFCANYRANLWPSPADAAYHIKQALPFCDIVKVNEEELKLLTGTDDLEKGTDQLAKCGITLILVTLGPDGAFYRYRNHSGHVPAVPCKVVDSNGAGDSFFAAVLVKLSELDLSKPAPIEKIEEIITFANRMASITVSRSGAIPAMPTLKDLADLKIADTQN